jgi:hypothetical protein
MFCEQCGIQIGVNESLCQKCVSIQTINPNIQKNKKLLISAIIGCSIILFLLFLPFILFGELHISYLLSIDMICGISGVVLSFIGWVNNRKLFALISGILYSVPFILTIIDIIRGLIYGYFHIYFVLRNFNNFNILFFVSAIINIIVFIKFKRK